MNWIFGALLVASLVHMGEEYVYPGGFLDFMKRLNPRSASRVTGEFAVIANAAQLLLCVLALVVNRSNLVISLSAAALLFVNGLMHMYGSIRIRGYAPGVITGVALYLPLSLYAYSVFWNSGQLTALACVVSVALGVLYQLLPISYLALSNRQRQA